MDESPARRSRLILEVRGSNELAKFSLFLISGTEMSTVSGTAPARSRHKGANDFQPVAIEVQFLGLEVIALRQYRQT